MIVFLTKPAELDVPQSKVNAQVLTEEEILELARYGIMLENHYGGHPQDIEFAIEDGKIAILQTRAITTNVMEQKERSKMVGGRQLLKGIGASIMGI